MSPDQLDVVLAFLPAFERPGFSFGEWHAPAGQIPFYALSDTALAFVGALSAQNLLVAFDWPSWQDVANRYFTDSAALESADLLTLRKLLTTHVRMERFVDGHLATVFESGHLVAILERLKALRAELELGV